MSCLRNVLFTKCTVCKMACLRNVLSTRCPVYEMSWLWNILSMKCRAMKCSAMKCPSIHFPVCIGRFPKFKKIFRILTSHQPCCFPLNKLGSIDSTILKFIGYDKAQNMNIKVNYLKSLKTLFCVFTTS